MLVHSLVSHLTVVYVTDEVYDHIPRLCLYVECAKELVIFFLVGISDPRTRNLIWCPVYPISQWLYVKHNISQNVAFSFDLKMLNTRLRIFLSYLMKTNFIYDSLNTFYISKTFFIRKKREKVLKKKRNI